MKCNVESKLFSIKNYEFSIRDFLEALDFFGILDEWRTRVKKSLKALLEAEASSKSLDVVSVAKASEEFRYENDLLNLEELQLWLNQHSLDETYLEDFLIRSYWLESVSADIKGLEVIDVSLSQIYSEIVLSGSFSSLEHSWQKRLVSWFAKNDEIFPSLDALEQNYKEYEKVLLKECDVKAWLKVCQFDLQKCEVEVLAAENDDYSCATLIGNYGGYVKDLPALVQKYSKYLVVGEVEGPFVDNDSFIWLKLLSEESINFECPESIEFAYAEYLKEVWKTLFVKHING